MTQIKNAFDECFNVTEKTIIVDMINVIYVDMILTHILNIFRVNSFKTINGLVTDYFIFYT